MGRRSSCLWGLVTGLLNGHLRVKPRHLLAPVLQVSPEAPRPERLRRNQSPEPRLPDPRATPRAGPAPRVKRQDSAMRARAAGGRRAGQWSRRDPGKLQTVSRLKRLCILGSLLKFKRKVAGSPCPTEPCSTTESEPQPRTTPHGSVWTTPSSRRRWGNRTAPGRAAVGGRADLPPRKPALSGHTDAEKSLRSLGRHRTLTEKFRCSVSTTLETVNYKILVRYSMQRKAV